jgi:VanZ family protein
MKQAAPGFPVNEFPPPSADRRLAGLLCVVAILAVLLGTLWPFHPFPKNDVTWLEGTNGLRFGSEGVVLSESPVQPRPGSGNENSVTLELLLRPANVEFSGNILTFYSPQRPEKFLVRQWTDGLVVAYESIDARGETKRAGFYVDHAFHASKLFLLTITSGPGGTSAYRDAARAQSFPRFKISPDEFAGQIVLGTSPIGYTPWRGEICGLAIYPRQLAPAEILRHYAEWISPSALDLADPDGALTRYVFSEHAGRKVYNAVPFAPSLAIPESFNVPHKMFLRSAVKEFHPDHRYVADVLINIAGFVPLGLILSVYFSLTRLRSAAVLYAALVGASLSFTVEVLQFYIPRRMSGTTDIITNTLGAFLGAVLVRPELMRKILRTARLLSPQKSAVPTQD